MPISLQHSTGNTSEEFSNVLFLPYMHPIVKTFFLGIVNRVETQDGGDAKVEVSPRDIIYTQPAEPLEVEQPTILHKLELRYGYGYILTSAPSKYIRLYI